MPAILTISADLDAETLQELTRELCRDLNQETDFDAELPETAIQPGEKGGETAIGQIALKWTNLAADKLTRLLKVYSDHGDIIKFKLKNANGEAELEITKTDLKDSQINKIEKLIRDVMVNNKDDE